MQLGAKEERHTASRMAMPAIWLFAGGNGWRISIKNKEMPMTVLDVLHRRPGLVRC